MKRALVLLSMVSVFGVGGAWPIAHAWQAQPNDRYSRSEADNIGARLFKAIVGRDGGASGPAEAATQIMLGHLDAQVEAMFNSPEFRQKSARMTPTQILDQIYGGLLDRKADDAGIRTYLRDIEQRKYASVVMKIIGDTEFTTRILGRSNRSNRSGRSGQPDQPNQPGRPGDRGAGNDRVGRFDRLDRPSGNRTPSMRAAESCQIEVLEEVRADSNAPVLLNFDQADLSTAGWGVDTVRGSAVDVLDRNHRLTYRCEMSRDRSTPSRVTYDFDDGRRRPSSGYGSDFPLPTAQSCQDSVRVQISRERGRREMVFESAGVSPWTRGIELVFGVVRERTGGNWFEYRCEMERGRVASADFQPIR